MKKSFVGCLAALVGGGLTGCTTMLTHITETDVSIANKAEIDAMVAQCIKYGYAQEQLSMFMSAAAQLLTVTAYSEKVYAEAYAKKKAETDLLLPPHAPISENFVNFCQRSAHESVEITKAMQAKYVQISEDRRRDAVNMFRSASNGVEVPSYGVPGYNAFMPKIQSVQPSFGMQKPSSSHYLIDAGKGMRLCTVSSSGVAMCN